MSGVVRMLALSAGVTMAGATQLASGKFGCGRIARTAKHQDPGAGMNPGALAPFEESFMDGFSMIGCYKDDMHEFADKFGDGKVSYTMGSVSSVSIVHYTETVDKLEREQMTHEVCFGFCRTVPGMMFFGITNGRDCYCMPYPKQAAGDSSQCDAVCDGNPTTMCGGKVKSSIFEMHSCGDAQENLDAAHEAGREAFRRLADEVERVEDSADKMQGAAEVDQEVFGKVGDAAATGHAQDAKVWAGKLKQAAKEGKKHKENLDKLIIKAGKHEGNDASLEKITSDLQAAAAQVKDQAKQLEKLDDLSFPFYEEDHSDFDWGEVAKLYKPVMYFVDKAHVDAPSTCGGKSAAEPMIGSFNACAESCEDVAQGGCVGFTYLAEADGLCILHSELATATYYTGCGKSKAAAFLQKSKEASQTKCVVKFAKFEGTTLKPDKSGKCPGCLKEVTKADRCFESQ